MKTLVALLLLIAAQLAVMAQEAPRPGVRRSTFQAPDGSAVRYASSIPQSHDGVTPVPLVVALHPGGERFPYIGASFMQSVVLPAIRDSLNAVVVAPDAPGRDWTDETSEQAVMALLRSVLTDFAIDSRRILVTGFSMGGRGAWWLSARHPSLFAGAIVMAGSTGDTPDEDLARIPTYVIHSRADEVVPFAPAERTARALEQMGRPVVFQAIDGVGHFSMGGYVRPLRRGLEWIKTQWDH